MSDVQPPHDPSAFGAEPTVPDEAPAGGRKKAAIAAGAVAVLAAGGAAAWGATSFIGSSAQPAEALPASVLAYASVNLDPSGAQKIEAIKTLRKFPGIRDEIGLKTDDDVRKRLFEELTKSNDCESISFADDVEPWLGNTMAVAALDAGDNKADPALVIQVTDAGAAEKGFDKIKSACGGDDAGDDEQGGWAAEGDWLVVAETTEKAEKALEAGAKNNLSADKDFQRWTDEAGGEGIVNFYVAPGVGDVLASMLEDGSFPGTSDEDLDLPEGYPELEELESGGSEPTTRQVEQMTKALEQFDGMAGALRFADGGVELETAAKAAPESLPFAESKDGGKAVAELPANTAFALGMGLTDGWFDKLIDQTGLPEADVERAFSEAESETGLSLPGDIETLAGEAFSLSLGSDFDVDDVDEDPSALPLGVKVKGDKGAIEEVLDKLRPQLPAEQASLLEVESDGDFVAMGPNADYREELLKDGKLGDSAAFKDVIADAENANFLVYVDFDEIMKLVGSTQDVDAEVEENLEPLAAFGVSANVNDDVSRFKMRLSTD